MTSAARLSDAIDDALPQTQCTRCGFPDCRSYANAIAQDGAPINQCPPGGAEGIARLARLTSRPVIPLNPANGHEGPRQLAVIDEAWCIGCTLCIKACPVDCIVGGAKQMHTVIDDQCTGCELCIPVCPVDCISLVNVTGDRTGWDAWSEPAASASRQRHSFRRTRIQRDRLEQDERLAAKARAALADLPAASVLTDPEALDGKRAVIEAALARARSRKATR
ncbi:MAG TPA: electron transport complex subunit RsxB [Albitalea sp.]|uniref:electron transport complex subunit RsxB n=1 Tax=Piscinibacter sp. TaxID=1903157 RepID=UPI002ED50879